MGREKTDKVPEAETETRFLSCESGTRAERQRGGEIVDERYRKDFYKKFFKKNLQKQLAMLICSTMTSTKVCRSCNREQDVSAFRKGRTVCLACKQKIDRTRISASYESYLRNLYSHSMSSVKKGRRGKEIVWDITPEDVIRLWEKQDGRCALSGVYLTHHKDGSGYKDHNASIDRISGEEGYTYQNTQLVCFRINLMKHTLSEDLFYWWIKTINDFSCD